MPTLLSRISVSCFDILDSMSGRGGAIISLGSRTVDVGQPPNMKAGGN